MLGKILLTRIDNRLVHGQVGVTWTNSLSANYIVVVDDVAANDKLQQMLMEAVAKSSSAKIKFLNIQDFVEAIKFTKEDQRIFVVVKEAKTCAELVKLGVPIDKVNIGNLHYEKGKIALNKKVYINEEDVKALKYLLNKDVNLFIQDVPDSYSEKITNLDEINFK